MKADLYSKVVLTVIALSLSVIAIQLTTKEAHAQRYASSNGIQMVAICDINAKSGRYVCADIVNDGQLRVANQ